MITVSSLHVYPLKSAAGIAVNSALAEARGFTHDRCWMLVDAGGTFLTQREHPSLALVGFFPLAGEIAVRAPGMELFRTAPQPAGTEELQVRLWNDTVTADAVSPEADAWFTRYLGRPCRLVALGPATHRPVAARYALRGEETGFVDAMPYHLMSEASLAELNARLDTPLPMDRFRPNIVVTGCAAFAEDAWRNIRIGGVDFRVTKPVSRCAITTVDQQTGDRSTEPLAELARFRRTGNAVLFGQYLIAEGTGPVRVGDDVEVL
jgi:uncharacterized protein YcbX